ncbi:MAG TPA: hypothetical protein VFQ61_08365, partial [Polyangiaceae bacterium]|nr:hypothetical protein [Polyangiaceae bacterium]
GTRYDLDGTGVPVSAALDLEYTFGSQNVGTPLIGVPRGGTDSIAVPNVFEWDDSLTARVGLEYRVGRYLTRAARVATDSANLPDAGWAFRVGYVLDTRATNPAYPTAFGTPPAATNVLTAGAGYRSGPFKANLAYAYRFGSAEVSAGDLTAPDRKKCSFCGDRGEYGMYLSGLYVDVGYQF